MRKRCVRALLNRRTYSRHCLSPEGPRAMHVLMPTMSVHPPEHPFAAFRRSAAYHRYPPVCPTTCSVCLLCMMYRRPAACIPCNQRFYVAPRTHLAPLLYHSLRTLSSQLSAYPFPCARSAPLLLACSRPPPGCPSTLSTWYVGRSARSSSAGRTSGWTSSVPSAHVTHAWPGEGKCGGRCGVKCEGGATGQGAGRAPCSLLM